MNKRRGSIRYKGPVEGFKGEWIGVEWDEEEGGKHDGTVNGKVYFKTRFAYF